MELAQYQLQIFVSLVVVLAAAFVALICDFLKGNNEQLRELAIELKVRREEDQRRTQTMTAQLLRAVATPAPAVPVAQTPAPPRAERKRTPSPDALAAMERGARLASSPRVKRAPDPGSEPASGGVSDARRERNASSVPPPAVPMIEVKPAVAAEAAPEPVREAVPVAGRKDWNALLAHRSKPKVEVPPTPPKSGSDVPAGFHDGYVLSRLVQSRQPVSGLVVSIGVNVTRKAGGSMPSEVKGLMGSLIGPDDFACQSSEEEFLLIYPRERGASAQRRLSQIAQQLWDFQLRSLGTYSILFSWGGVEVSGESIEEAIASANQRMQETRRGRKLLTMERRNESALRKAV